MDPVPYEIREEDVDEVLSAYEGVGGGAFTDDERAEARRHIMRHVLDIDEIVRAAPEDRRALPRDVPAESAPREESYPRRELALAAIEDLLIRDGYIDASEEEARVFPIISERGDLGE